MNSSLAVVLVGVLAIVGRQAIDAKPPSCDTRVRPKSGEWGYGPRGDRCEGLYDAVVGAPGAMRPVSLLEADLAIRAGSVDLRWTASPSNDDISIVVTGLGTLYRMDTRVRGTRYSWPTDVLTGAAINTRHIGIVAVTSEMLGNRRRDVYLPVRLGPKDAAARQYVLRFASPENLEDLTHKITALTPNGDVDRVIVSPTPTPFAYRADDPPPIVLEFGTAPAGLYLVEIDAKRLRANAGRTAMSFVLRR
jgi:hypothetical protein